MEQTKEKLLMNVAEYFLSRKKYIDSVVEGEHKWFGSSYNEDTFNNRPWYLETEHVSKTE